VDFWHAVEFSRNGRFLRTAFQQALRASFFRVSSLPDVFRPVFRSFIHPIPELAGAAFATSTTLAHSEFHSKFTPAPVGGNANEPIFMGIRVRVGLAE
ncbi:hypothetical protein ACFRMQ_29170, partial [Kitasatospora sp. NPDC056783]|uniref:hypothetical protein n=1 Tax=Kitasatospora sp. NPDC056783 TaxID=3345943 RepID=UPI003677DB9B